MTTDTLHESVLNGLPPEVRERFQQYSRFVETYMAEDEPLETFPLWERFVTLRRYVAYHRVFYDDIVNVVNRLLALSLQSAQPPQLDVRIGTRSELLRAPETVRRLLAEAISHCEGTPGAVDMIRFLERRLRSDDEPMHPCRVDDRTRKATLTYYLSRVIDRERVPAFFDRDYLDDLESIIRSRYCCGRFDDTPYRVAIDLIARLCRWEGETGLTSPSGLRRAILETVDDAQIFTPPRWFTLSETDVGYAQRVPDAARDYDEYLAMNERYSRDRRESVGTFDNREISLFRGNELDHRVTIRTIISLIKSGELQRHDQVLVIGSRYRDEIVFFRQVLQLAHTVGLDLVEDAGYIEKGDMHGLPFEEGRFKLVYCAGTLSYSHNARLVLEEMARVCSKPGFVVVVDAADRCKGVTMFARSELMNAETIRRMFYNHDFETILFDDGRSMVPHFEENSGPDCYRKYPAVGVRIHGLRSSRRQGLVDIRW